MADALTLLDQYAAGHGIQTKPLMTPTDLSEVAKQQNIQQPLQSAPVVDAAGDKKKAGVAGLNLPTSDDFYRIAVAEHYGKTDAIQGGIPQDLVTLSRSELAAKYGPDVAQQLVLGMNGARGQLFNDLSAPRNRVQTAGDIAIDAGLGAASPVAGMAALTAGVISPDLGTAAAEGIQNLTDNAHSYQSDALTGARKVVGVSGSLSKVLNDQQYEQDKKTDGKFVAGLTRIGREAISGVQDDLSNSTVLGSDLTGGVGSMLALGPEGKLIGVGAKAILPARAALAATAASDAIEAAAAGKGSATVAQHLIHYAAEHGSTLGAIGATSGGSSYADTVNEAVAKGATPDEANRQGLVAAAIAAPAAAAAGPLIAPLAENPVAARPIGKAVLNVAKAGVEGALFSGSGQEAKNIAEGNDLSEGVGGAAGSGALYGAMTAGALEAPGVVARMPIDAGKAAYSLAKARVDGIKAGIEDRNTQAATKAQDQAVASVPELSQQLKEAVPGNPELHGRIDKLLSSVEFDPAEAQGEAPVVQRAVQGATDRYQALRQVAEVAKDPKLSDAERAQAGAYLDRQISQHQDTLVGDLHQTISEIDDNHPVLPKLRQFEDTVIGLSSHPLIRSAMEVAEKAAAKPDLVNQFSKEALSTPEGVQNAQQTANAVLDLTARDPTKADPTVLDTIRAQAVEKTIQLSDGQMKTLDAAYAIVRATRDRLEAQEKLGLSPSNSDQVTHEVQTQEAVEDPEKSPVRSGVAHAAGVEAAYRAGELDVARTRLQDLALFAQHLQNKLQALNASYAGGNPYPEVGFKALSPTRKLGQGTWYDGKGQRLVATKEGSVKYAQSVANDARAVTQLANGLVTTFPELGVKHVTPVSLEIDPNLERKAADIVQEHQPDQKTSPEPQVNADKTQVDTAEKVGSGQENTAQTTAQEKDSPPESPKDQAKAEPELKVKPEAPAETPPETSPETVAKASAAPEAASPRQPFDRLLGSEGGKKGLFARAFRFPEDARSKMAALGDKIVSTVTEAFKSAQSFTELLGSRPKNALKPEILHAYQDYLSLAPKIQDVLEQRLKAFLTETNSKGETVMGAFGSENSPETWRDSKVLNLVEPQEDGSHAYNPQLLQAAVLAGLQWVASTQGRPDRSLTPDDVAEILGLDPLVADISPDLLDKFNQGTRIEDAAQGLASTIQRFWGVQPNDKIPEGFTKGIPEAMAKELLAAMAHGDIGLLSIDQETLVTTPEEGPKTYQWVSLKDEQDNKKILRDLARYPDAIEQLVSNDPEETRYIEAPPKQVAKTQIRNPLVKNTPHQVKMIGSAQETPHYPNEHMINLYESLGNDLLLHLFGAGVLDEERLGGMNVNTARSLKGRNLSIEGAFQALSDMMGEVRNRAEEAKTNPYDMRVFYRYNVSKVGRLQMLGSYSPQASKLMREAILPTRVTIDLTKPANLDRFMLAAAQMLGEKIHRQSREVSARKVQQLVMGDLAPALAHLDDFLDGGKLSFDEIDHIKETFANAKDGQGVPLTPAAIHAALELARYYRTNDRENFQTHLYVEADGVTDGPVNALVHLATGAFSTDWLDLVAKGGLFLGAKGRSMNAFISDPENEKSKTDLYQETTNALKRILARSRAELPAAVAEHGAILDQLMAKLLPDVSLDEEGNLLLERGVAKNPLTVTIYGSGVKGIAEKVVGTLTSKFYEELSKKAAGEPNQADDVQALMEELASTAIVQDRGASGLKVISLKTELPRDTSATQYTLTEGQKDNLTGNVLKLFVNPMHEAIEATIADTQKGRVVLRRAVQVQSIFAQHVFKQMVEAKLAEKPEGERKNFLSRAELNEIHDELIKRFPLIDSGEQSFFPTKRATTDNITASEAVDKKTGKVRKRPYEFARTLDGKLSTSAYIDGPSDVGVGGIPYVVQGFGDALMIQKLFNMEGAPQGILPVFDGVHLKIDTLDEDARKVNQAVYEAWQNNPMAHVQASFTEFLKNASFEGLSDEHWAALKTAMYGHGPEAALRSNSVTQKMIESLGPELEEVTRNTQARHEALAQVGMSVDHMAGPESPYEAEGKVSLEGLSDDEKVAKLNELMQAAYDRLGSKEEPQGEPKETPKAEPQTELTAEPKAVTEPDMKGAPTEEKQPDIKSAEVIPAKGFAKLVNGLAIPAEQKNLLKEVIKPLLKQGWQIVRGTPEQTTAHALDSGETPYHGDAGQEIKGYTNLGTRKIYLHNDSGETLLHELLHAAVSQKILDHYQGTTNPEISEAITHLETLMGQWMEHGEAPSDLSPEQQRAYEDARRQVLNEQNNARRALPENRAAALDEFLAWNLSNQDLIKLAQKTKVENSFSRVVKRVLISLKNLIWGRKMSPMVRSDMYSALRFNASVMINSGDTVISQAHDLARFQSASYGASDRLSAVHQRLIDGLGVHLKDSPSMGAGAQKLADIQSADIERVVDAFDRGGFPMTMQGKAAFKMLMQVMATNMKLNQASLAKAHELYVHALSKLTPQSFMADPTSLNQQDEYAGQQKLALLNGIIHASGEPILVKDTLGRTSRLPAFMALAMVHDDFRKVLSRIDPPKASWLRPNDHLDNVLMNLGNGGIDLLARTLSGVGRNKANVQEALDALTERLVENTGEQNSFISQVNGLGNLVNRLNEETVRVVEKGSKMAVEALTKLEEKTDRRVVKNILHVSKLLANMVTETGAEDASKGTLSLLNGSKLPKAFQEIVHDLVGETDETAPLHALIKQTKGVLSKIRQEFRDHLPEVINKQFSQEPTEDQQTHLFHGLARSDLATMAQSHSLKEIRDMLAKPAKVKAETRNLETEVRDGMGSSKWDQVQAKIQQLAHFQMTGEHGHELLRNSEAIVRMFGPKLDNGAAPDRNMMSAVDRLATLYALEKLSPEARDTLSSLAQKEAKGLDFMLSYLIGQRRDEQAKLVTDQARINHYKGYIPSEAQKGASLVVADDADQADLLELGYRRGDDYKGSFADQMVTKGGRRGYYFSPVSGHAPFEQGGLQTARQTASGVDPVTGYTHDSNRIAGRVTDPLAVKRLAGVNRGVRDAEPLMPIYDQDMNVVAFERSIDPKQDMALKRDTNLARMIGAWRGRQVEEALGEEFNRQIVKVLGDRWEADRSQGKHDEYVDLFNPKELKSDPVLADAAKLFTPQTRELIKETFGGDGFRVRKDMLNDAIGSRMASVGDAWTGVTRLNPKMIEVAKNAAIGMFGVDAYRYLVTGEKILQSFVKDAKKTIIVRSMIVPVSNMIFNVYQMGVLGISPLRVAKGFAQKLPEVSAYAERRLREIDAGAELRVAQAAKDEVAVRKLTSELAAIKDLNQRMSLWPLIEAGELSSISSSAKVSHEEFNIYTGNVHGYFSHLIDKLPPGLRSLARYELITPDTPLFRGMARATEYGDFLAKAITYDHLTQEKGLSPEKALNEIREEFVNYDRSRGRTRGYLESIGMAWFLNYKLRSTKIAYRQLRRNPVHMLLASLVPPPPFVGKVGTPMRDNFLSVLPSGRMGYSLGPHMGIHAETLSPWSNIFGIPIPEIPLI